MNKITKTPVNDLGYNFVDPKYLPKGKDEYYLRFKQNPRIGLDPARTANAIKPLISNGNTSGHWKVVYVTGGFSPSLVQRCKFSGLIRIGNLESFYPELHELRLQVGLYNSYIISSDIGD